MEKEFLWLFLTGRKQWMPRKYLFPSRLGWVSSDVTVKFRRDTGIRAQFFGAA
jgi:hypothetical protein